MANESFYFDPHAEGLAVFLGPTEAVLMDLLWRQGNLTVKRALALLGPDRSPAYTTVMSVLTNLTEKGLARRRKSGRSFVYEPAIDRDSFLQERIRRVTACLRRNFPDHR